MQNKKTMYFVKRFCFLRSRRETKSLVVAKNWIVNWKEMVTPIEEVMLAGANPIIVEMIAVNEGKSIEIVDSVDDIIFVEGEKYPCVIQTTSGICFSAIGIINKYKTVSKGVYSFKNLENKEITEEYDVAKEWYKKGRTNISFQFMKHQDSIENFFEYDSHRILEAGGVMYIFE